MMIRPTANHARQAIRLSAHCLCGLLWLCSLHAWAQQPPEGRSRLVVLAPAHPHGVQIQLALAQTFQRDVYVYAPHADELQASYLNSINRLNRSATPDEVWKVHTYVGDDFIERMLQEQKGDVAMIASNNQQKADQILEAAKAGLGIIADKPMALNSSGFAKLRLAMAEAEKQGRFVTDLPAMSMRNWVPCILQKELVSIPEIFGTLEKGSAEDPAIVQENMHYYYKRIKRPAWFFDVKQQGNGVTDVTTHLADLVLWTCFPTQAVRYDTDIEIVSAELWPTTITPTQFKKATRVDAYPDFLKPYQQDSVLEVFSNGQIVTKIKGVYARFTARWEFEAAAGKSDTHQSVIRGTRATLRIKPGYPLDLYIEPADGVRLADFENVLRDKVDQWQVIYPFISLHPEEKGWRITSEKRSVGKETRLVLPSKQEVDRMLAKYYITTQADAAADWLERPDL
ncbi:putative oxidoreductase C-terminal domain-containing protein [Parapedobacter sp. 10938]|uniref:putative oxidoreductase C-terminal domain-containing protein n=1 Tax=Parapedobacter flavus TaxID=3110225 RepID=UPI002DB6F681|nr:putative oxidoreductase C-terminal domain-containing protein [Parapedobacter sp. 10938]MEC3880445.1 putative oxidoreductase C-terminal domain-containing protein [Parapedobacter sp. 10938]